MRSSTRPTARPARSPFTACARESTDYAVDAGVDQIEHAGFIADANGTQAYDSRVVDKLARSGIPVTSTLSVGGAVLQTMRARKNRTAAEEALLTRWTKMHGENLSHFRQMREAGVNFVAGTDAGWRFTPFDGLPMEMELMNDLRLGHRSRVCANQGPAQELEGFVELALQHAQVQ